ncbi:glycosyltransferase [Vibrio tritonius]|uniref:Glycosyltransferase n=1 Tax=Vibrio tritonius TaxID=1435069 RepID=A0ABS7YRT0_9VIBR|nr:glycosyltransferase [Vibrio tritonius]MCA2017556.1 glycosyltransferase [Vibrio tritonius]
MKILHIVESTATGTLSMVLMAVQAQVSKHEVSVIYSKRRDTPKNIKNLFPDNVHLFEVSMGAKSFPGSIFRVRKTITKLSPDIIHCHSSFGGFVGRLSSLFLRCKVFYSPHCISFMRKDIGIVKFLLFSLFERVGCLKKATYIACSESEKKAISDVLKNVSVVLLENAVDLSDFVNRPNYSFISDTKRIVSVGGVRKQKGFEEFADIAIKCSSLGYKFIWVGDGDEKSKKCLENAGVEITGWKSREEVINILQTSDLYLSTSLWEGMPVSVIEACAAGLPLLLRNCPGNCDIVINNSLGHLFSSTDEAISYLNDFSVVNGREKELVPSINMEIFNRFSIERFSLGLEDIYRS